jgi:hypothetical protein
MERLGIQWSPMSTFRSWGSCLGRHYHMVPGTKAEEGMWLSSSCRGACYSMRWEPRGLSLPRKDCIECLSFDIGCCMLPRSFRRQWSSCQGQAGCEEWYRALLIRNLWVLYKMHLGWVGWAPMYMLRARGSSALSSPATLERQLPGKIVLGWISFSNFVTDSKCDLMRQNV